MKQKKLQHSFNSAHLLKRGIAYFIDWYIISILTILPINLIYGFVYQKINFESSLMGLPVPYALLSWIMGLILTLLYLVYLPYKWDGMTIGKRIFSIQIVKLDQSQLDIKTLLLRNGIGLLIVEGALYTCSIYFWELMNLLTQTTLSSPVLSVFTIISLISFGLCVITKNHLMIHDFIGHTIVVNK